MDTDEELYAEFMHNPKRIGTTNVQYNISEHRKRSEWIRLITKVADVAETMELLPWVVLLCIQHVYRQRKEQDNFTMETESTEKRKRSFTNKLSK